MQIKLWQKRLLTLPPMTYLIIFFAVPSLIMLFASFRYAGEYGGLAPWYNYEQGTLSLDLTLDNWRRLFETDIYLRLFLKSIAYAVLTCVLCLLLGYPLALMIARSSKKRRDLLLMLVILPFWSNFLVRIYAWMIIFSPTGVMTSLINRVLTTFGMEPVTLMYSATAVIITLVYVHLPFMVLPLYANLEKHNPALLDAAQDLGANGWRRFWNVTWPLSLPGVYAGSILVFIPVLGIFAIPELLGGTDGIMIANVIKQQFVESRDWPFGSVLSMVMTVVAVLVVLAGARFAQKGVERA